MMKFRSQSSRKMNAVQVTGALFTDGKKKIK